MTLPSEARMQNRLGCRGAQKAGIWPERCSMTALSRVTRHKLWGLKHDDPYNRRGGHRGRTSRKRGGGFPLRGRIRRATGPVLFEARRRKPRAFLFSPQEPGRRGGDRVSLGNLRKGEPDTVYLSRHRAAAGPRWALEGR